MDTVLNEACDIQIWREKKGKTADTRKYENDKNCAGCEMKWTLLCGGGCGAIASDFFSPPFDVFVVVDDDVIANKRNCIQF